MKKLFVLMLATVVFTACNKNNNDAEKDKLSTQEKLIIPINESTIARTSEETEYNTFYGPAVQFGDGYVRSWANISREDKPLAIGFEFTEGVFHQQNEHPGVGNNHGHEVLLTLHQKAKALMPFDHLTMGYMVNGHPPPGIYTVPHFDFHFYKMALTDRLAIPTYLEAKAAFDHNPAAGHLPPAYVKSPAGEPKMGAHWLDVLSPEFSGQPFTHTFVYGSYDGKVTFLEPMASINFFMGGATVHKPIRQPQVFDPVNTYYPTQYSIWRNEAKKRHYIAMDEMLWR